MATRVWIVSTTNKKQAQSSGVQLARILGMLGGSRRLGCGEVWGGVPLNIGKEISKKF